MRASRALLCCALAVSAGACATVTRGSNQAWTVKSTPPGATVKTSTGFTCEATPCTFKMPRKSTFEVTVTKAGYKTYQGHVVHVVSTGGGAGFVGNALIGGVIGAGVDVATGATMDLKPNPMEVTLEAEAAAAPPAAPTASAAPATAAAPSTDAPAATPVDTGAAVKPAASTPAS